MSDLEINYELKDENSQNTNSNEKFLVQQSKWQEIQSLISKSIKEIFWKTWIKPLKFEKYEKGILYFNRSENNI